MPLGGNRSRAGRNLLLTMLLGGLWHGANWTFLAWGAWHGLALAIQRKVSFALPKPLAIVATFHFLVFGFIWFRAPNLDGALRVFGDLASISWRQSDLPWLNLFLFLTVPLLCAELWSHRRLPVPTAARAALIPVGVLSVVLLGASQGLPFVYFQF